MTPSTPPVALCLDCNYSLHGLAESRCPECGREFDPGDPWTSSDIQAGRVTPPVANYPAGPMTVKSTGYGGADTLFFHNLGRAGGIAHCPTKGPAGYYNEGAHG